jgi:4-oxalmesaconate hydratase
VIIDAHGHYTTYPPGVEAYRGGQIAQMGAPTKGTMKVTDDEIRQSIEGGQLKQQRERGTDLTLFSPRASWMGHHFGNELISRYWTEHLNDLISRVCQMFPDNFASVCMLPQSPGVPPASCIPELERCVTQLGSVGCLLSPDPSGGYWREPPLTDRWWYPLYEKLVELDVPAMVHVSATCNPAFHQTGSHYLNADTTAFMQFVQTPQLFRDFPGLRFIIPHGGGAVPYHWGRYRGMNLDLGRPELSQLVMQNVWFDTCVYHQPGMDLLFEVIPTDNLLFASEMIGAVRGKDPLTGHYFDDTKRYVDALGLGDAQRQQVFEGNARRVFPRLAATLERRGVALS